MTGTSDQPVGRENPAETPHPGPLYPYPPGYPPPSYAFPPAAPPKNGFGMAALVLAVIGLLSVATVFAPIALGAAAVILGVLGRGRANRGIANNGGVAIAGIVLGALAIVVGLAFIAIWTTVWKDVRGGDFIDCIQRAGNNQAAEQHCADQFRHSVQDRLSVTLTPKSAP
ncbi:DUF4190 domain-containing protein [Mycobacterium paraterrae]|uniref:DUF4190 domain-containing protein n=1 Tax=Mycobacterium paraterrae TaxID=577492 RepID=A0ABY3VQM6_9MYCO|nr:DUF4190 domain-containing protein [Mycobacterium paraterrae]UMB71758.1 DUF4190 domain-containing protein [Mycobacterium paraterrae]